MANDLEQKILCQTINDYSAVGVLPTKRVKKQSRENLETLTRRIESKRKIALDTTRKRGQSKLLKTNDLAVLIY